MRKLLLGLVATAMVVGTPAMAASPAGSNESKANKLTCNNATGPADGGANVYANGNGVYAGSNGVELCSDDDSAIDGRVIVSSEGFAAVDGDDSNPDQAQGWARLDSGGPTCTPAEDPKKVPTTDKDNDSTYGPGGGC